MTTENPLLKELRQQLDTSMISVGNFMTLKQYTPHDAYVAKCYEDALAISENLRDQIASLELQEKNHRSVEAEFVDYLNSGRADEVFKVPAAKKRGRPAKAK